MKQTPCEYIVWHGLPVIRKAIARSMINDFNLNKKEAAENLGITPSAVSQYLSGKRGKFEITDNEALQEIKIAAERIINQGNETVIVELCRLCRLLYSKKLFPAICESCEE